MAGIRCISSTMVQAETHKAWTQRVELTPWDLNLFAVGPVQKGLLFPRPKPSPEKEIENTLIQHLKASLAHTLDYFPPLAGRLATNEHDDDTISFCIDCNNAGALFIHAEADGVTELMDGVFVGCTINHSVVDGSSFWHFFNSWSEISRGSIHLSKLPVFQRSFLHSINYPIRIPRSYAEQFHEEFILPPNLKERVFHFTKQSIAKLKERANAEVGTNSISSLQALLSHIWRSVIRNKNLDPNEEMIFYMLIGARARLRDLPKQYFGNAVKSESVKMKAKELQEKGVGDIAWQMNRMIATQTEEEFKKVLESWIASPKVIKMAMMSSNVLIASSSPRFNMYGNDFGWGKPIAARSGPANKFDGKLTLFPGAEEGSIDIEACILSETLHVMANDQEFMDTVTIECKSKLQ
ncbi:uncharacterized acetyltransferase At3g50280-like isoform X5 [Herrania umbratica]|uniref:Uncharacterized acetyltransferase At3g50280-like isoform X5 n=1 Tax=Herrania umbratica TaxID=108875 RepID=A0A6J0ZJC0_9ROSI|nr:uncharacterized acetyltransferase At3g50280-like isoform X5 [Herrania umbratica]